MKVVINSCFGGFGVSVEALKRLIAFDSKIVKCITKKEFGFVEDKELTDAGDGYLEANWDGVLFKDEDVFTINKFNPNCRTDPILVEIIEDMGESANGKYANLKVVEIPDGVEFQIDEYDGSESIHEVHRSWY